MSEGQEELEVDEGDVHGVLRDEERLRELREEKKAAGVSASDARDLESTESVEESARVQRGRVRDYGRDDSGYRTTYTFVVDAEDSVVEVSLRLPRDEYSLDNELVRLLEWKGIDDGRIGELLNERVYVDTEDEELVLPSSLSPVSRLGTHLFARGERYKPDFDYEITEGEFLAGLGFSAILLLMSSGFSEALSGFFSSVFGLFAFPVFLLWLFFTFLVLVPVFGILVFLVVRSGFSRVRSWWVGRYHEL